MKHRTEWNSWRAMKEKCNNCRNERYKLVGGRGISYDSKWESFEGFYADMGDKPSPEHCLFRKDNTKDYCKENCEWRTQGVRTPKKLREQFPSEYGIWKGMKRRCEKAYSSHWNLYDGRGIKYCERWKEFGNFIADMGPRPNKKYSLDRVDNNGDYCPQNCRWATQREQLFNSSKSIGKKVHEWDVDSALVSRTTIYRRLARGWSIEEAINISPVPAGSLNRKKVQCIETGEIFPSIQKAADSIGAHSTGISAACRGIQGSCGGKHWRFI